MAKDAEKLTPKVCLDHCQTMADATYKLAETAEHPHMIEAYLDIASNYVQCADQAKAITARVSANIVPFPNSAGCCVPKRG